MVREYELLRPSVKSDAVLRSLNSVFFPYVNIRCGMNVGIFKSILHFIEQCNYIGRLFGAVCLSTVERYPVVRIRDELFEIVDDRDENSLYSATDLGLCFDPSLRSKWEIKRIQVEKYNSNRWYKRHIYINSVPI